MPSRRYMACQARALSALPPCLVGRCPRGMEVCSPCGRQPAAFALLRPHTTAPPPPSGSSSWQSSSPLSPLSTWAGVGCARRCLPPKHDEPQALLRWEYADPEAHAGFEVPRAACCCQRQPLLPPVQPGAGASARRLPRGAEKLAAAPRSSLSRMAGPGAGTGATATCSTSTCRRCWSPPPAAAGLPPAAGTGDANNEGEGEGR